MHLRFLTQQKKLFPLLFSLKFGATLSLFALSILIVACGSSSSTATTNNPQSSGTINMNSSNASPTLTLPPYSCGAWATQTSPPYGTSVVGVYAKFVQNVKSNPNDPNDVGNPQGIAGASAIATVLWPDGTQAQVASTTGTDGLAAFSISIANRADAINKITLVTVQFTKDGVPPCTVGQARAAFFTLLAGSVGTSPSGGSATPGTGPTPTPTVSVPVPKPTKTPTR